MLTVDFMNFEPDFSNAKSIADVREVIKEWDLNLCALWYVVRIAMKKSFCKQSELEQDAIQKFYKDVIVCEVLPGGLLRYEMATGSTFELD